MRYILTCSCGSQEFGYTDNYQEDNGPGEYFSCLQCSEVYPTTRAGLHLLSEVDEADCKEGHDTYVTKGKLYGLEKSGMVLVVDIISDDDYSLGLTEDAYDTNEGWSIRGKMQQVVDDFLSNIGADLQAEVFDILHRTYESGSQMDKVEFALMAKIVLSGVKQ